MIDFDSGYRGKFLPEFGFKEKNIALGVLAVGVSLIAGGNIGIGMAVVAGIVTYINDSRLKK